MSDEMYTFKPCERAGCNGFYRTYKSVPDESAGVRVQYFRCRKCKHLPDNNQVVLPLSRAPKRKPRRRAIA